MGYYSRVQGDVGFSRKPQELDAKAAAARAELTEQLREVGGSISFESDEVPAAFTAALRDDAKFDYINAIFEIEEDIDSVNLFSVGESGKVYGMEDEFRALVQVAERHGVLANGTVTVTGEEAGDIWRLVIRDNDVTHEETKIVWPDGSEYKA